MPSTLLIEQCVTRLRGIVETLDNIHDSTPHRWSTDLDEVHSSAESLLAMIKDQAPPSEDQLIAAGLSYPLAKEDAVKLWYAGFRSEVVTVLEAWEAIGHDIGMNPSKGELLDSLRNMAAICNAHGNDMPAQSAIAQRQVIADAITGALAFGAQASQPPAADHWLRPFYDLGRAEGQRTQELAMLVRMLASALKRHAPDSNLVARATNYLAAKGLAGTPLRDSPALVEQAGGDERAAFEFFVRKHCGMPEHIAVNWDAKFTNDAWEGWKARAAWRTHRPVRHPRRANGPKAAASGKQVAARLGASLRTDQQRTARCSVTTAADAWSSSRATTRKMTVSRARTAWKTRQRLDVKHEESTDRPRHHRRPRPGRGTRCGDIPDPPHARSLAGGVLRMRAALRDRPGSSGRSDRREPLLQGIRAGRHCRTSFQAACARGMPPSRRIARQLC